MTERIAIAKTWKLPDGSWVRGPFIERTEEAQASPVQHSNGGGAIARFATVRRKH